MIYARRRSSRAGDPRLETGAGCAAFLAHEQGPAAAALPRGGRPDGFPGPGGPASGGRNSPVQEPRGEGALVLG